MTFVFFAITALLALMSWSALYHSRLARRLPGLAHLQGCDGRPVPACSVVIAARDEEARIARTIEHLLKQEGVELKIIVVDDRSTDGTSAILKRFAQQEPRVQVKRVDVLPEGWLGKCHACHVGASMVTTEWILFSDADCWIKPDAVRRALLVAEREKVEHVTLTPGVMPGSAASQGWHLAFLITMASWVANVNRDRPKAYLGIGAFNLVQTAIYRKFGGHEALRLTVVDDLKLGLLVRRAGGRTRGFIGGDDVTCDWGLTVRGVVKVMEKNYFATVDFRVIPAVGVSIIGPVTWLAALAGPFTGTLWGIAAGLALLSLSLPAMVFARRLRWSMRGALLTPFAFPLLYYAMLNSVLVTLKQGGIRWRDTFYSLQAIRAGRVR